MNKNKLNFFDKKLLSLNFSIISAIFLIESFVLSFFEIGNCPKKILFFITIVVIICIYIIIYFHNYSKEQISFSIGNNRITIKFGDIFIEDGIIVAGFNEYFDTLVDEKIIEASSINGQVIKRFINNISSLDKEISNDLNCKNNIVETNSNRSEGKKTIYRLGTCYNAEKFIAVALTRFDEYNKGYLNLIDYLPCLVHFWKQLNKVYPGDKNILIPLLGTGKTRSDFINRVSPQQIIEIMLKTLEFTNVKFSNNISIVFVLPENIKENICLYKLR